MLEGQSNRHVTETRSAKVMQSQAASHPFYDDSFSSPRCVISISVLGSSSSNSPSGSKAVSEMEDYSDVKQLITQNLSFSPSDADDDNFFIAGGGQKGLSASALPSLDIPHEANLIAHTKPMQAKDPKFDSPPYRDRGEFLETLEREPMQVSGKPGMCDKTASDNSLGTDPVNGHQMRSKIKGVQSLNGSRELVAMNSWTPKIPGPLSDDVLKTALVEPVLESLLKISISEEGQVGCFQGHNQGAELEDGKRRNCLSNLNRSSLQSSILPHAGSVAFSFNQTHSGRISETDLLEYDSNYDSVSNSSFEFNRGVDVKAVNHSRTLLSSLTKPAPSKWDDAEKWLSSEPPVKSKAKSCPQGQPLAQTGLALSKKAALLNQAARLIPNISQLARMASISSLVPLSSDASSSADVCGTHEYNFDPWKHERTARMYGTDNRSDVLPAARIPFVKSRNDVGSVNDRYSLEDLYGRDNEDAKDGSTSSDATPVNLSSSFLRTEKPTSDSPPKVSEGMVMKADVGQSKLANEVAPKVYMRDMGTEMTPVASLEPSRAPTPVSARTPTLRSPSSSGPTTPSRVAGAAPPSSEGSDGEKRQKSGKELQSKTRQEILVLGTQLGKHNIAAWATKEEEEEDAFKSLKSNVDLDEVRKNIIATRAAAWEEAEHAKFLARYKREEARIQTWENHEKAKAEAELRKIEMKIEQMRSHANEKLMNKMAATRRHAEELRAAASARRGEQASKTAQRAEYIRRTGKVPGSMFANLCCL